MIEFGHRLREKRKELGLTVKQVASRFGVAQPTWSLWEIGSREPSLEMLAAICRELHISLDKLLGLKEPSSIHAVVRGNSGNVAIGHGATVSTTSTTSKKKTRKKTT